MLALATAIILVIALWRAYVIAPWTRDGRVSVHVVRIAPEVSGTVTAVEVQDNQWVKKDDVLYRIDPERFELAVAQAKAQLDASTETLMQRKDETRRRTGLDDIVPKEDIERSGRAVAIALADVQKARAALDVAELNLRRSVLRAPVDGFVNHLRLRQGDYAVAGSPNMAVVDTGSFWITGYFEETKLRKIHAGDAAQIKLMGFPQPLTGHVVSIGRGISDDNDSQSGDGLPAVNPTFSWVRLAQRIPVHIAIDTLPDNVVLAAGMTTSIDIYEPGEEAGSHGRLLQWLHAVM